MQAYATSPNPSHVPSLEETRERLYAGAYEALAQGDLDYADKMFGMLAAVAPTDERPWIGLAVVKERRGQWRAAAGFYQVGTKLVPGSAWCHFGRGRALAREGMSTEAMNALDVAETLTDDALTLAAIAEERGAL